ncbi:IclR family pca regulon transcriptional regulator [Arthrobacter ulcerisalmonis]|uniref:IclR family transcriptional regulator n=1 Tax=Arthrobacter sp. B1I2 TaxID=3042263 RepID=UPI0027855A26|nr:MULTISPECIES: IclR family transcriptional regulator [Arthrobacter]MDQ0665317.1 IclR family pca regulon transcriptional regulator [Arthrobacter ulcerisalmonis]MDQ0733011.1 IclR family pca regulon transcriptional regulator [Arthrobacter sp. B1I2]
MSKTSSMGRGVEALLAVGARHADGLPGGTVADVAADLGRDRSQVSRSLRTAEQEGFLARTLKRSYALDWQVFTDAQLLTERRLESDGGTVLDALAAETGEACFLGVLRGDSTVTIGESVPSGSNLVGSWLGRPYPAYCSDAGQAVLWEAPEAEVRSVFSKVEFIRHGPNTPAGVDEFLARRQAARERGYSIVDEEAEPGLYSLAVPVRDFKGEVVAALQIVGIKERLEPRREPCAAALVAQGQWLESRLGYRG